MASHPLVRAFFDPDTYSYSYVVSDPATQQAVVIDPVHNFDLASGCLLYTSPSPRDLSTSRMPSSA